MSTAWEEEVTGTRQVRKTQQKDLFNKLLKGQM
jgi:hypothetical protein